MLIFLILAFGQTFASKFAFFTSFKKAHGKVILYSMKISNKGMVALLIALLELSFVPILLDVGGINVGSIQLLFYVFLVGTFVSLPIALAYDRKGLTSLLKSRNSLVIIVIAGLFNNAISQLLLALGTIGTNPSISAIVFRSWVLMAAVSIPFVMKIKVSKWQLAAIFIGFIGMYLALSNGTFQAISAQQLPYMLLLVGCAACATAAALLVRTHNASTTASIVIFNLSSVIFLAIVAFAFHISLAIPFSAQTVGIILFLGIATYSVGSMLYYHAYKTLNPIFVSNAVLAVPFITIFLSSIIIGTVIRAYYLYSTAIIAGAVLAQQLLSSNKTERISKNASLRKHAQVFDVTSAFINNKALAEHIQADGRALAIKFKTGDFNLAEHRHVFEKYKGIFFTGAALHEKIKADEMEFINEIMGQVSGETVLVGIGAPDQVEGALGEFTKNQNLANNL
jgi:drug/metabolite transporter (DMT)-like permease